MNSNNTSKINIEESINNLKNSLKPVFNLDLTDDEIFGAIPTSKSRPPNSYLIFKNDFARKAKLTHTVWARREISKAWRDQSKEVRKLFRLLSEKYWTLFKKEYPKLKIKYKK